MRAPLGDRYVFARTSSWERLLWLVRERPATCVVLDEDAIPPVAGASGAAVELRSRFPSLALVLIARPKGDPFGLLALGRAAVDRLVLVGMDNVAQEGPKAVARSLEWSTEALVVRELSAYLPGRVMGAVRLALEGVQRSWGAEQLAREMKLTRPHLSVLLKGEGLPSAGHLLLWARLLHAGRWLVDPARSAESVSRQLEYSSGAAFRRALKSYTGVTPTQVIEKGGLTFVLNRFLTQVGIERAGLRGSSAA